MYAWEQIVVEVVDVVQLDIRRVMTPGVDSGSLRFDIFNDLSQSPAKLRRLESRTTATLLDGNRIVGIDWVDPTCRKLDASDSRYAVGVMDDYP